MTTLQDSSRSGIRSESCCGRLAGRLLVASLTRRPPNRGGSEFPFRGRYDFFWRRPLLVVAELGMPLEHSRSRGDIRTCLEERKVT